MRPIDTLYIAAALIVCVLVLVLLAARDPRLGQFKFRISASPLKIDIEVESQRQAEMPPGDDKGRRS